jgi:hypothetical protein
VRIVDDDLAAPAALPRIVGLVPQAAQVGKKKGLVGVRVAFSQAMKAQLAARLASYRIVTAGADGRFGTADDRRVAIKKATYNAKSKSALLTLSRPIASGILLGVWVKGNALRTAANLALDGDDDGTPGGDHFGVVRWP